jgi:hypothetical protein
MLSPTKIAISLDAASADIHDRIRGVAGAWAATDNVFSNSMVTLDHPKFIR